MIDPTKDNFIQPPSVKEILDELEISKCDYYRALSISKDKDLELHLKREPNSCFVNNYFDAGLKAWQAIMDMQPVKAVKYVSIFLKNWRSMFTGDETSSQGSLWEQHASSMTQWKQ